MNNKGNKILLYLMLFQKNRIGVNQLKRKLNLMKLIAEIFQRSNGPKTYYNRTVPI